MHLKTLLQEGTKRHAAVCLLLFMTVLLLFARTGSYEFLNYDDDDYVYDNQFVREGLTLKGLQWAFTATVHDHWHPLTWLSHMADCQLFGLDPGSHHLVNALLHALNALVLFLLLRRMTGQYWASLAVAVLFAVHPMNVQSVAWISERKNLLSTLFAFLSLYYYALYVGKKNIANYIAAFCLFCLGLLSKSMLVTLPLLMLLLDFWPLNRAGALPSQPGQPRVLLGERLRLLLEKVPFLAASAIVSFATLAIREHRLEGFQGPPTPLLDRIIEALPVYTAYVAKLFRPVDLAILYPPFPPHESWLVTLAALILAALTLGAVLRFRTAPHLTMGWIWYLVSITPVIGIVQIGPRLMADRYAYLTFIGLFMALVWTAAEFAKNNPKYARVAVTACVIAVLYLSVTTWKTTSTWQNSLTVFENTLKNTKNNPKAHVNYGLALLMSGKTADAIRNFEIATRLNPKDHIAHFNLANFHFKQKNLELAEKHYRLSIAGNLRYEKSYTNLGITLINKKRLDEAEAILTQALKINTASPKAAFNLGLASELKNKKPEAIAYYTKTLELSPGHQKARERLDVLARQVGSPVDAARWPVQHEKQP